jgi:uncharacterized membrane protein
MNSKYNGISQMIVVSIAFTIVLLAMRFFISGELTYVFYVWNLFLAAIPIFISSGLYKYDRLRFKVYLLLASWLLFFPNAPYIITDIFHFRPRPPLPLWFDLLLVISAAWNGLIIGAVSLLQVEDFLQRHLPIRTVNCIIVLCLALCAFGIYMGRFLRYNSWDVVTNPYDVASSIFFGVRYPFENVRMWGFTVLFTSLLAIVYFSIKQLRTGKPVEHIPVL